MKAHLYDFLSATYTARIADLGMSQEAKDRKRSDFRPYIDLVEDPNEKSFCDAVFGSMRDSYSHGGHL